MTMLERIAEELEHERRLLQRIIESATMREPGLFVPTDTDVGPDAPATRIVERRAVPDYIPTWMH